MTTSRTLPNPTKGMRIGAHVRTGKGLDEAVERAGEIGCEALQVFAANPSAWHTRPIPSDIAAAFRSGMTERAMRPAVIHTQYLLNLASPDDEIHGRSVHALADSLVRADVLGAEFVVTHIGSHRGLGEEFGLERVRNAVREALSSVESPAVLLLENAAGAGDLLGGRFEDLRAILQGLSPLDDRLGVCLDTAHLWGAGFDLSDSEGVERTLDQFDGLVGLDRLKVVHLNDSRSALGSRSDRHANIGQGEIGMVGIEAVMRHPAMSGMTIIIETPMKTDDDHARDIALLKEMRSRISP
ncbi:MAG: deoxyribonuclease IV [Armatimonadetes bacterium]|nr:deoxyribonuclease IV [Armatimonadota bacterium]